MWLLCNAVCYMMKWLLVAMIFEEQLDEDTTYVMFLPTVGMR